MGVLGVDIPKTPVILGVVSQLSEQKGFQDVRQKHGSGN